MRHLFLASVVIAGICSGARAVYGQTGRQPAVSSPDLASADLPDELNRVLRDYEREWQAKRPEGLAALFTEDGLALSNGRPPVRGRPAIIEAYRQAGGALRLRGLAFATADTVGYIIGAYRWDADTSDAGKFILALRRSPGGPWLIAADIDNTNRPPRSPARQSTFTIESRVLAERRVINVYTPPGYETSARDSFPVVYMPDGGMAEDFPHIAGTIDSLIGLELIPPVILVGIENTERRRDLTGPTSVASDSTIAPRVGGSAAFRSFIRDELMPEIRGRYRTADETTIVGESLAGLFIVETLLLEPALFNRYIALDPSLWWNDGALLRAAGRQLANLAGLERTLYLTASSQSDIAAATARLDSTLKAHAPAGLTWHFEPRPDLEHGTIYRGAAPAAFVKVLSHAVLIAGPSVVAFWRVPASDSVLEAEPDLASALDDQQYYWSETRPLLEAAGVAALDQPGRTFMVAEPKRRWRFTAHADSAETGFLLVAPGRAPRVIYGRQFPDDMLAAARDFFSTAAADSTAAPSP